MNFVEQIIRDDQLSGKHTGRVHTRFPPEPNGYLHIGHAKAICLNFGLGLKFNGKTNLRFDDTNPTTEDTEYVNSIKQDIEWLGFEWDSEVYFTSDYFDQLYDFAVTLIKKGKAYVDDSSPDEIAALKGTPTKPGKASPYRDRSIEENLQIFQEMNSGKHPDGSKVLRAKIDMAAPNMHFRDPVLYRIKHEAHHRTGTKWCIYPMYDFAHGQSDSIEKITHSVCTLEFENHRPLYNWFIEQLEIFPSRQIEFARLALSYTVTSKRKLLKLVEDGLVNGWDDPRMPTLSGMRRRGYTAAAIRNFCEKVGVAKRNNVIDVALLEYCVKEDLNRIANRVMVVLDPIKVVLTNYPQDQVEHLPAINNPQDESAGERTMPFSRELFIEGDDFMEEPPNKKYFRLAPGKTVRLKHAYIIQCNEVIKNELGQIEELHCTYFPDSKSGQDTSGIKVKGTLHWVSSGQALNVQVRQYDRLFNVEDPAGDKNRPFTDFINPDSYQVLENVKAEPSLNNAEIGESFQFLRKGYFTLDRDSGPDNLIFNRTVTLRDAWAKSNKT